MSHWKKFTNNALTNTNMETLGAALAEMGLGLDTTVKYIQNAYSDAHVDMAVTRNGKTLTIGFADVNGTLELRGDFWTTGLSEANFLNELSQKYTKTDIVNKINRSQYTVESVTENENGEIEILAYTYA